jgi:ketopantoate reductase
MDKVKVFTGIWTFEAEASGEWITSESKNEEILRQSQDGPQQQNLKTARERHCTQFSHTITIANRMTIGMLEKFHFETPGNLN